MEKQECAAHYFITHFQNVASPHDVMDSAISDLGKGLPIPKRAMYFRRNRNVSLLFIVFSFVLIEFLYFVYQISVAPTKRSAASRTSCRLGVVTRKPQSTEFIDSGEHRRHYQLTLSELVPSTRRVRRPFSCRKRFGRSCAFFDRILRLYEKKLLYSHDSARAKSLIA